MTSGNARYFITRGDSPEQEVTEEEFVRAEREAGFYNTRGRPSEPATASFSSGRIAGRTDYS